MCVGGGTGEYVSAGLLSFDYQNSLAEPLDGPNITVDVALERADEGYGKSNTPSAARADVDLDDKDAPVDGS